VSFDGRYAGIYDALYGEKDYGGEIAFVEGLLNRHAQAPVRRVLDLGCGTGRHGIALAERGYSIAGVDMASAMLARAEARRAGLPSALRDAVSFHLGDIRSIDLGKEFDAVVSLFHVMSYQTTDADVLATLETAKRHLPSGGLFLFDFWHGPAVLAEAPARREKRVEDGVFRAVRRTEPVWEKDRDIVRVIYDIDITDTSSGEMQSAREEHVMRYFFRDKISTMAMRAGFSIIEQGEWLTGLPPRDDVFNVYALLGAP
jgi:SAM-dependent methyltransferase